MALLVLCDATAWNAALMTESSVSLGAWLSCISGQTGRLQASGPRKRAYFGQGQNQ